MYCPDCGTENPDNASFCTNCGKRLTSEKAKTRINFLSASRILLLIASLLLIFWGLVYIVYGLSFNKTAFILGGIYSLAGAIIGIRSMMLIIDKMKLPFLIGGIVFILVGGLLLGFIEIEDYHFVGAEPIWGSFITGFPLLLLSILALFFILVRHKEFP